MVDYSLLKRLCSARGISGDEGAVRDIILSEISDFADDIRTDALGNLIVFKKGKNRASRKLMFSAHLDEVGLMVTDITSEGYIKFDEVGGIDRRVLPGKRVYIGENAILGVIGIKPVHLSKGDESDSVPEYSDMYIDIGAADKEEAEKFVSPGDSVSFESEFIENEYTINSKAIDDRFGCYVLIELIKSELEYDAYFAFVVQEETGLSGSKVAAYTVNPDCAVVIETTTAADIPEVDAAKQVCRLGGGAVISVMDRRTIYDKELVKLSFERAEKIGVKAQYKRAVAGGNDAGEIHKSRGGVRTVAVSLACRCLHSPSCVARKDDCESVLALARDLCVQIAK